jgi:hypothetical protein
VFNTLSGVISCSQLSNKKMSQFKDPNMAEDHQEFEENREEYEDNYFMKQEYPKLTIDWMQKYSPRKVKNLDLQVNSSKYPSKLTFALSSPNDSPLLSPRNL